MPAVLIRVREYDDLIVLEIIDIEVLAYTSAEGGY